jgi:hypothetical protein
MGIAGEFAVFQTKDQLVWKFQLRRGHSTFPETGNVGLLRSIMLQEYQ